MVVACVVLVRWMVGLFVLLCLGREASPLWVHSIAACGDLVVLCGLFGFVGVRAGGVRNGACLLGLRWPGGRRVVSASILPVVAGVAAIYAWQRALVAVKGLLEVEALPQQQIVQLFSESDSAAELAAISFAAVVLAAFCEEVLFRGMLYLPLRAKFGPVVAAVVVSAAFALLHLHIGRAADPVALALAGIWLVGRLFILALALTCLFESTGSLLPAMVAHGLHNGLTIAALLAVRAVD